MRSPLLLLLPLVAALQAAGESAPRVPPNIVFIFADDLGWQETGFSGSDFLETPHLDRLAREGLVFRQAYASAGNCQPSRASMFSGQYTPRHGVYAVNSTVRGPRDLMRLVPVPNRPNVPSATVMLGESLKAAGYATGLFGKSHLKMSEDGKSEHAGFDVIYRSYPGLNSKDPHDPKAIFSITRAACDFIESNRERPFFAYLAHYAVHSELQGRAQTLARFKSKAPGRLGHDHASLAACLLELDTGIGAVLDKLRALGLERNTLVIFTSDNGGTHVSNEPLRGMKGGYYEGGIRVPMIVRWPGMVAAGATCDVPVVNLDFYPTFLAVAHAPAPSSPLDGESLLPLFRQTGPLQRKAIFWHFPGYLDGPVPRGRDPIFRTRPVSVIRKGGWKLHLFHEEWLLDGGERGGIAANRSVELYHLTDDPGERTDLASSHAGQRDELLKELTSWIERVRAPLPKIPSSAPGAK